MLVEFKAFLQQRKNHNIFHDLIAVYRGEELIAAEYEDKIDSKYKDYFGWAIKEHDKVKFVKLIDVPKELAKQLVVQGTGAQEFVDNIAAAAAADPYRK